MDAQVPPGCVLPNGGMCPRGATCPAGDGCNTCQCTQDGRAQCTLIGCIDAGGAPCRSAGDCPPSAICLFTPGCAAPVGTCQPAVPCAEPVPFCGCDGRTYLSCQANQPLSHVDACEVIDGGPMVFRYPGARFTIEAPGGFAGTGPALSLGGDGILRVWFNTHSLGDPSNPAEREDRSRALTAAQVNDAFDRLSAIDLSRLPHPGTGGGECAVEFYSRTCATCAPRSFTYLTSPQVLPELQPLWDWFDTVLRADEARPGAYCAF